LLSPAEVPLYTCEAVLTETAHLLGNPGPVLATVADGLVVCPWDLCEYHARVRELDQIMASLRTRRAGTPCRTQSSRNRSRPGARPS